MHKLVRFRRALRRFAGIGRSIVVSLCYYDDEAGFGDGDFSPATRKKSPMYLRSIGEAFPSYNGGVVQASDRARGRRGAATQNHFLPCNFSLLHALSSARAYDKLDILGRQIGNHTIETPFVARIESSGRGVDLRKMTAISINFGIWMRVCRSASD